MSETKANPVRFFARCRAIRKVILYNTAGSHIRLSNGYVKMTENESTYSDFTLKFNKFSRKNSLLAKTL